MGMGVGGVMGLLWMMGVGGVVGGMGMMATRGRNRSRTIGSNETGIHGRIEMGRSAGWEIVIVATRWIFVVWRWRTTMKNSSSRSIRIKAWLLGGILLLCAALLPPLLGLEFM